MMQRFVVCLEEVLSPSLRYSDYFLEKRYILKVPMGWELVGRPAIWYCQPWSAGGGSYGHLRRAELTQCISTIRLTISITGLYDRCRRKVSRLTWTENQRQVPFLFSSKYSITYSPLFSLISLQQSSVQDIGRRSSSRRMGDLARRCWDDAYCKVGFSDGQWNEDMR